MTLLFWWTLIIMMHSMLTLKDVYRLQRNQSNRFMYWSCVGRSSWYILIENASLNCVGIVCESIIVKCCLNFVHSNGFSHSRCQIVKILENFCFVVNYLNDCRIVHFLFQFKRFNTIWLTHYNISFIFHSLHKSIVLFDHVGAFLSNHDCCGICVARYRPWHTEIRRFFLAKKSKNEILRNLHRCVNHS